MRNLYCIILFDYDLDLEVREHNATTSQPALVASTTACRVQTVSPHLTAVCITLRRNISVTNFSV